MQNGLPYRLRKRLLSSFLVIIALMVTMHMISLFWSGTYYRSLSDKLVRHVGIHNISVQFIAIPVTLSNYISSGNSDYVLQIQDRLNEVQQQIDILKRKSVLRSTLYYQLNDVSNMVTSLSEQIDALVADHVSGRPLIYVRDQENSIHRHIGYIQEELSQVNSTYMESIQAFYSGFSEMMGMVVQITLLVTIVLVIVSMVIARRFTLSVSRPIHTLALTMLQFGKGDLEATIEPVHTHDEISVLIDSFNHMGRRIKRLIQGIREKAEIERQLKSQELVNQESQRLLRESELALLQSQINPHFLFNTLNTISTIAQIEESFQTEQLINNLSTLLRYNLKNQNEMVKLEQEIMVVRSYLHIQQTRFGDKITFIEKLDPDTFEELVPSMLLQPLIENAIKHGLEPVGRKGTVELHIEKVSDQRIRITIRDDGTGIDPEVIAQLYTEKPSGCEKPLGLYNVMRRLELCYGSRPLTVTRRQPRGTECTIELPTRTIDLVSESVDDTPEATYR